MVLIVKWQCVAFTITLCDMLSGCRSAPKRDALDVEKVETPDTGTTYWQTGNFYIAGQPAPSGLEAMRERGVRTVVNLRTAVEKIDFDEKAVVEGLGIAYVNIPVTPQSLNDAKVEEFNAALKNARKPVLIHCASAQRAAAFWGAYAGENYGLSPEDAIHVAEQAGLTNNDLKVFIKLYLEKRREARATAGGMKQTE